MAASGAHGERDRDNRVAAPTLVRPTAASDARLVEVCQFAAGVLAQPGTAAVTVLLRTRDTLRCYAMGGTWRVHDTVPADRGAIGTALATGHDAIDDPVDPEDWPYPVVARATTVLCVPITDPRPGLPPIGVLKLDLPDRDALEHMRAAAAPVATVLGTRLAALEYSGAETPNERVARAAYQYTIAADERELLLVSMRTVREISGLSTAIGLREPPGQPPYLAAEPDHPTALSRRAAALAPDRIVALAALTERHGTWYTSGPPELTLAAEPRCLLDLGARTVIAVPVDGAGFGRADGYRRTMLALDERASQPDPATIGLLMLLTAQARVSIRRLELLESLRAQAGQDPLTGLGHQAKLNERMTDTTPGRTAMLLVDIDYFKDVNDTQGHAAGDQLLVDLAGALRRALRPGDELFRVGGDEFAALLDGTDADQARRIAQRLLRAARQAGRTVSIGVAMQADGESAEHAMRRADAAMYTAKGQGRNRVRLAPEYHPAPGERRGRDGTP